MGSLFHNTGNILMFRLGRCHCVCRSATAMVLCYAAIAVVLKYRRYRTVCLELKISVLGVE